ncbi:MAG TPA: alkaline phosphatase family protein [Jiangellaceae bacterium]|nr:alkaline phosphatase family protein [Jiangellaceae bacterium]
MGELDRAVAALTAPELADIVDLVAWPDRDGGVMVANSAGTARLRPDEPADVVDGVNPVADQNPMAFLPYERELADPSPPNVRNAYPYAAERLLSFFADTGRAPDLAIIHTPPHYYPEAGGHPGEHGSLDVVQSRAPLLLSGAGVAASGLVDGHVRLPDIGPTLAWLCGVEPDDQAGRLVDAAGAPLDGIVFGSLVGRDARWVVGVLWDGAHCGDLLHLAAEGELPAIARLLDRGCALRGGAIAEFPSVTLTNHTSILTGVGPGRHGVLGNVFYDRRARRSVNTNDATTWHRTAEWLRPGVATVFELVREANPEALSACVNEPVDRGADYSTMQIIRNTGAADGATSLASALPDPAGSIHLHNRTHVADGYYAWATQVDDAGLDQVLSLWNRPAEAPLLTWWSSSVTDAGHHAGGPRSEIARDSLRDADHRLGAFLDHLDRIGATDEVIVILTADHGFEGADPGCRGGWDGALRNAGVQFRDEGPGFIYLGESWS